MPAMVVVDEMPVPRKWAVRPVAGARFTELVAGFQEPFDRVPVSRVLAPGAAQAVALPGVFSNTRSIVTLWIWTFVVDVGVAFHGSPVAVTVAVQLPVAPDPMQLMNRASVIRRTPELTT